MREREDEPSRQARLREERMERTRKAARDRDLGTARGGRDALHTGTERFLNDLERRVRERAEGRS